MADSEIVREFLVESYENLDRLDQELVSLESNPANADALASIFRTIHTIKGTCGFFGFTGLEAVTHVGESLLARLRDGHLTLDPEITTALLQLVDTIRQMLANIEQTGNEGERDDTVLIATLARLQGGNAPVAKIQAPAAEMPRADNSRATPSADTAKKAPSIGELLLAQGSLAPDDLQTALDKQNAGDQRRIGEILVEHGVVRPHEVREALTAQHAMRGHGAVESTIRVDVSLLDQLMNLVGELVLVRNQILQFTQSTDESGLVAASQRLNLTTRELQEGVMKTRMQSIGTVWARFPRTVRDIAHACGKQVRIGMEGENTELDRTIIEAIKDPLTHLIRNAVDHGIEDPATRVAAGKNAEGVLSLRAFHEGAYVSIEIKDDGAGLDLSRVRAKAARNNLVPADQLARMSDRDITNLIFLPGFSTAETVTKVSGRGVGMDVVKTNIEKVGGTVDILTARGEGTTVRMKIPLTLTIIPALIVSSDNSRYAIPQMSLLELVRLEGEQIRRQIETVHGSPVYRLRGHLLPLVYLKQVLRGASSSTDSNLPDSGYGTEELDFSRARSDHEQYLLTLQGRYAKNEAGGPTGADLARSCPLGDWIQRVGINKFSTMPEMYELGRADKAFHDVVDSFLALGTSVDVAQAKGKLEELARANHRITRLLTAIEALVIERSIVNIVVLQARDQQFGLIVDAVNDTAEIVVKPLGNQLKRLNVYSGATITGDGKVVLILDSVGLAQRAHIFETNRTESVERAVAAHALVETVGGRNSVVLVECGANQRLAIALSSVARLEEFAKDSLETTGEVQSVQYRGQIMRLLRISDVIHPTNRKKLLPLQGSLKVVVFSVKGQHVGLVVDRILDIADEAFVVQEQGRRNGILGCAVIQQRITDILDVPALIAALDKTSRGKAAHA